VVVTLLFCPFYYPCFSIIILYSKLSLCRQKDFNNAVFDERTVILCDQVCFSCFYYLFFAYIRFMIYFSCSIWLDALYLQQYCELCMIGKGPFYSLEQVTLFVWPLEQNHGSRWCKIPPPWIFLFCFSTHKLNLELKFHMIIVDTTTCVNIITTCFMLYQKNVIIVLTSVVMWIMTMQN
jgi:hypothetical protein